MRPSTCFAITDLINIPQTMAIKGLHIAHVTSSTNYLKDWLGRNDGPILKQN